MKASFWSALAVTALLLFLPGCSQAGKQMPDDAAQASCGGTAGVPCPQGQWCDLPEGASCGEAEGLGQCRPRPEACTMIYAPVCGCDGKTYGNACQAQAAGVEVGSEGECRAS